jgi:hypothetical protein
VPEWRDAVDRPDLRLSDVLVDARGRNGVVPAGGLVDGS